jgi:hypothetical protein
MLETIGAVLGYINEALRIMNPFLFMGATCIWVRLNWKIQNEMSRNMLRQYCIESQIDYIVNNRDIDREYIDHLRKIYSDFQGKKAL